MTGMAAAFSGGRTSWSVSVHRKPIAALTLAATRPSAMAPAAAILAAFMDFDDIKPKFGGSGLRALPHLLPQKLIWPVLRSNNADRRRAC